MKRARYLLTCMVVFMFFGCRFFESVSEEKDYNKDVTGVSFDQTTLSINQGESEYLKVSLSPSNIQNKCSVKWEYDDTLISLKSDSYGAVVTGLKGGGTYIKATCNNIVATCLVSVIATGDDVKENPYIYSNNAVVELQPANTAIVSASLYGGSVSDMEFFEWSIVDSSVADISYSRNNCVITAKKTGSTQLICHHPNAQYDYTYVIYVYTDKMTEPYITTEYNVFSINKNEVTSKTVSVNLVNPINAAYTNGFKWEYADEESKSVITLNANLATAEIVPLKNGIAKINVTHENAQYPLSIIVRVNTIVQNTYIGVSESSLLVDGSDTPYTIHATIENYSGYADPDKFVWEAPEDVDTYMTFDPNGNSCRIVGKKNGAIKIKVSHELSEYSRNILVILQNQIGSAVDASMYITTDQNYVQTKIGAEPTTLNIRLVGGEEGEQNDFVWYMDKGENNGVAKVTYVDGSVADSASRSAVSSGSSVGGQLIIEPIAPGTLNISIEHPRCLYPCEIAVKVYSQYALLEDPVTVTTTESLIKMRNDTTKTITATLANAATGDENDIAWSSADISAITVTPSTGASTEIKACGTGNHQTYVTAHLDKAIADKKILVLSADTEEALAAMKCIYTDTSYLRVTAGDTKSITLDVLGLESMDKIVWTVKDSSVCTVSADAQSSYNKTANIEGLKAGVTTLTASLTGAEPVSIEVTVVPVGESADVIEAPKYLTTNLNAIVFENIDDSQTLSVTGVNIPAEKMISTNWTMADVNPVANDPVFDIVANGESATLTALKKGKTIVSVSNALASNTLKINAKCGELYEWTDGYIVYITTEKDVVNILNGDEANIACALANTTESGKFSWEVTAGKENIEIVGSANGQCHIKGIQAGQALITVANTLAGEFTKEILVNVANSEEELNGFRYLTTTQNVITVGENSNVSVSVDVKNAETNVINGYSWRSVDSSVATVIGSGNIAVVYGKKCGTTKVIVENSECGYPLELIVNTVDPIAAAEDPYIMCNNIVTCTVGGDNVSVAAELIGGTDSDTSNFAWSIGDSSMATLYPSNDSAQIKALKPGVTQVVISHPKASVDRKILVICEPKVTIDCHISITESIIKMSPSDSARTITATLVNGDADDVYDFKWWADSYDKINMNYTGDSCVIEPISSGQVTLHCSHPKAPNIKDIILYISNYTDFAFETTSITLTTGSDSFINMEVPATGVDCVVAYSSSDTSVCTVSGNASVCTLHPGTLPPGVNNKTCTIKAVLQTKGGAKQAEAELLVAVQRRDETKPYIALGNNEPTVITMKKDEIKNLKAYLFGNNVIDTSYAGLQWEVSKKTGTIVDFSTGVTSGSEVKFKAFNAGKTVIKISHAEAQSALTVYVIVAGVNEPTVSLNYSELPIYIGEDAQTLIATVQNDTGEELQWDVIDNQEYFTFTSKGAKASLFAQKVGSARVTCKIPSSGSIATCNVVIKEPESIKFFVYDDEINKAEKFYVNSLILYPGESKLLHYETIPSQDKIKTWYVTDNQYYGYTDKGYVRNYGTYSYPENVGTVVLTGKAAEGPATLSVTTESMQTASVSINNTYGDLFEVNKTLVSKTPTDVAKDGTLMHITYKIRPACSKLVITQKTTDQAAANFTLKNGTKQADESWVITTHNKVDKATGIASGTLEFAVNGECNCNVLVEAINENIITSGTSTQNSRPVGSYTIPFKVYYSKYTFAVDSFSKLVPTIISNTSSGRFVGMHSNYDKASNTIFLGDGEYILGSISVNEPNSSCFISNITFEKNTSTTTQDGHGKTQKDRVSANQTDTTSHFQLYHDLDYGKYQYNDGSWKTSQSLFYGNPKSGEWAAEARNSTVKEKTYVGNLKVTYFNYASKKDDATYLIPVYVEVRNDPCASDCNTYKRVAP